MAVSELVTGRRKTGKQIERQYSITGTTSEAAARTALLAAIPAVLDTNYYRMDVDCGVEEIAEDLYVGTGIWATSEGENQQADSFSYSFDISAQPVRVEHSLATVNSYPHPLAGAAANFHNAINVKTGSNGLEIEGVDMLIPVFTLQLNYTKADADMTESYIVSLHTLVAKVNTASFKGFAAGTLLLTGVSGQRRTDGSGLWDLVFKFAVSENKTGISKAGILGIDKKGWEYLWIFYVDDEDTTAKTMTKKALWAYVEQVYETADYSALAV